MNNNLLAEDFLDIGSSLLVNGAEISRVENYIKKIAFAYGAKSVEVFAITSSIFCTFVFDNNETITLTKRINCTVSSDFIKVKKLSILVRECSDNPLDQPELRNKIKEINSLKSNSIKPLIGAFLFCGAFAFFFGGNVIDSILAAACGCLLYVLLKFLKQHILNIFALTLIASLLVGTFIGILPRFIPYIHVDKISIGSIMYLIPGLAVTNSARDILTGDTVSGSLRIIQSLVSTFMICLGFYCAIFITNTAPDYHPYFDGFFQLPSVLIGSLGYALICNTDGKTSVISSISAVLIWSVYLLCELYFKFNMFFSILIAVALGDILAHIIAGKYPSMLYLVPIIISFVPGSGLYYSVYSLISGSSEFFIFFKATVVTILSISMGIGICSIFFATLKNIQQSKK